MADTPTLSLDDVEIAPSLGADDVEIAQPQQVRPEVQRAIQSVPRPQLDYMQTEQTLRSPIPQRPTPVNPETEQFERDLSKSTRVNPRDIAGAMAQAMTAPSNAGVTLEPSIGPQVSKGIGEVQTPGQRAKGVLRLAGAGLEASSPVIGPAVLDAPVSTAMGFGEGYLAGKGARKTAKAFGASPETQDLAENVGQMAPVIAHAALRPEIGVTTTPEGSAVSGGVRGAGAGVAVTPSETVIRGKVGPFSKEIRIPRGSPAAPALEPQTIEGELAKNPPTRTEISESQAATQYVHPDATKAHIVARRVAEGRAATISTEPPRGPEKPAGVVETRTPTPAATPDGGQVAGKTKIRQPITLDASEVEIQQPQSVTAENSPETPAVGENSATKTAGERRLDTAERKRVEHMTPEEMKQELLTSKQTGLPNRRAFDEVEKSPAVAMSDADGLKAFNDKFGYEAGNALLQAKADALREAGVDAYHDKGDEFLHRGASADELKTKLENARQILRDKEFIITNRDGSKERVKGVDFSYGTGKDIVEAESGLKAHKSEREARGERARGELRGITQTPERVDRESGAGQEVTPSVSRSEVEVQLPPDEQYKHRSTQINIPSDSEAHSAIKAAQQRIAKSDLMGEAGGKFGGASADTGVENEPHVTVRYGFLSPDDDHTNVARLKKYISSLAPFEASLGKTEKFPPSESSDGAAVIHAPIQAPQLHQINKEVEKHAPFTEPTFDYSPHATVAYVKPEKADRYVGMSVTHGKKFKVNSIAITDRNGNQEEVPLQGKSAVIQKSGAAKPQASASGYGPVSSNGHMWEYKGGLFRKDGKVLDKSDDIADAVAALSQENYFGGKTIEGEIATPEGKPSHVLPQRSESGRDKILESEIKHLKTQAEEISKQVTAKGLYHPDAKPLTEKHTEIRKQVLAKEDELARLKGEPTRSEKSELQAKEAEKPFAERPKEPLSYDDPKHSQHWQVLEPDYIERRFKDKVKTYERAIAESQQERDAAKPGTKKRSDALMNLKYREDMLKRYQEKDPRLAQSFKTEYNDLVKKALSQGKPVPQAVIDQKSEFKLAQDARERYEKGRHTSFANKSAAINDTMQKEEGFKVKRQDGKPITDAQMKEISSGVDDVVKVLGEPLRHALRGTDLTIAHTSGKHPFLSDAGGLYHPVDRTISAGINDFMGRPVKAMAHELGHWFDYESGRAMGVKSRIYTKGGVGHETQYTSEAENRQGASQLYSLARNSMTDTREAARMLKITKLSDLPETERAEVERVKVVLGTYWREPRELFARMFEQYIADELGRSSTATEDIAKYHKAPAWWSKEAWDKLKPLMAQEIAKRMEALNERYAPTEVAKGAAVPIAPTNTEDSIPAHRKGASVTAKIGAETYYGNVTRTTPEGMIEVKLFDHDAVVLAAPKDVNPLTAEDADRMVESDSKERPERREVIQTAKPGYYSKERLKGANGKDTQLLTSGGELPAKYRVVEASDLVPSHNSKTFARNARYPEGVQERAYDTSKEAQSRVIEQSQKYDPNYTINTNPDAVNGPPIITPDGIVLGGNSRAMSTQRLYKAGNGNRYKSALLAQAQTFGVDKDVVRMIKEPVLVREVEAPKTLDAMRALGSELNKSMTGSLGVNERAVSAGKAVSRETLSSIAAMIDSVGDSASLRDAMRERGSDIIRLLVRDGAITERERPQFVDTATGGLSEEGKTFVERALLGSVVDDPRLMDAAPKSVLNKLDSSLAALSSLAPRTDAYNILPLIRDALKEHSEIASKGIPVEDHLNQSSLFGGNRNPGVDALVRTLAEKPNAVKQKLRQFAQDANFDVQGQGMLALGGQPSPSDAFNAAFGTNLSDEDLENAIIQSAQSDTGAERDGGVQSEAQEGSRNLQQPASRETRTSGKATPETTRSQEETKLSSLLSDESGSFTPSALSPSRIEKLYSDFINRVIDEKLDLGDKYRRVADHDSDIAKMLHEKDHAPRYFRDKAQSNVDQVIKGLSDPQIRLTVMMVDSDAREYLEANHPEQFEEAQSDPAVMAAVDKFKRYQEQLSALRINLGWHVRRDLSMVETEAGKWEVIDRDGNAVETFDSARDAQEYVEDNGTVLDHLKRTYPEHLREPLMGHTDSGPHLSAGSYGGIRPPKPDKKQRLATGKYFYEHGAKDFSGYLQSFTQASHATLNKKIYDQLTTTATPWKEGTAQPSQITYQGKTYYRPDIALSMRQGLGENKVKHPLEYRAYDPAKDDKLLLRSFEDGWGTLTTGKPGIGIHDRWLAPKEVVEALDNYDKTRGYQESDSIRRFFQEQIVGLFGPTVHMLNIMRRLAHVVGSGAWDPRVWPYYQKLFFSKELRDRMAQGLADEAIDALSKYGTYTNARDVGSLHAYFLGNLNPANWVRQTIGKFSKGMLFDPKFMGGLGGMDQKARVLAFDFLRDHEGMGEEEASKNVDDGFGNYNKASWTERMLRWAKWLLFPGWDFSSLKWFLRHPFKTAVAPALATIAANLAIRAAGKNKDQDKYDFGYLHYGDRKFRSSLFTESMAMHLAEPVLTAARTALEGGDRREIGSAVGEGVMRGGGGVAGNLRPDAQMIAALLSNRQYLGGTKEIWKAEDANIPGKVMPNRKLDKLALFTAIKALPAISRFLDSSYDNVDVATGVGSVFGVTNYKSGAEERLRANAAKAKGYSETLSSLAQLEPGAADKFVSDPRHAVYLVFSKDLDHLTNDLKDIDQQREKVALSPSLSSDERRQVLTDLNQSRKEVLSSADALNEALSQALLQQKSGFKVVATGQR